MTDFPTSAEVFYSLRDDRTNRCNVDRAYQRTECTVYLSPEASLTVAGQAMLLVSANLLSRWCRNVTIVMPQVEMHAGLHMGAGALSDCIMRQMADADPFGDFRIQASGNHQGGTALYIGYNAGGIRDVSGVFINASGWLAAISDQSLTLPAGDERNVLGAIVAACLGVAQLFKMAIGVRPERRIQTGVFDVFRLAWVQDPTHRPWPGNLDVGRMLMVGAGSVGSSAAYCMRLCGLAGHLTVIDGDITKIENFNRSPIFGRATYDLPKAEAIENFLSGSLLNAVGEEIWWDAFLQKRGRASFDFDLWLPLANEFDVRRAMQHNVPPPMIYASTTLNWGINHGRHIPGRDDCLSDRFLVEVAADDLTCATGSVTTAETVIDAALPFASLFAGALIAADLVRLLMPEYPQVPNFALFDWFGPLDTIQAWDRKPREGCICREQGITLHDRFNGRTRYRHLFEVR